RSSPSTRTATWRSSASRESRRGNACSNSPQARASLTKSRSKRQSASSKKRPVWSAATGAWPRHSSPRPGSATSSCTSTSRKEPTEPEYRRLRDGLVLFTYLHIAADEPLARALVDSGIAAVAYETVETDNGGLPLLAPMSEIAGRLAAQAGAYFLERPLGGRGLLLGGIAGVAPGKVVVIGGGMVGYNAAVIALGLGANVTILER